MAAKYKVLLYEQMHSEGTELLQSKCELVYARSYDEADVLDQAADADAIIIRANGSVTRAIIESSKKLKVIGRHGVGLDAIDLEAAEENGVKVVYTPMANKESVAEHFVALALMLAKKMRLADIALIRRDGVHLIPEHDIAANMIYSMRASDVDTVICNGQVLMRNRELLTINVEEVKSEVNRRLPRLLERNRKKRVTTYPT